MEVKGKIIRVGEVQQVTDSFKKREFVIETNDQYPQRVKFELHQDKVDLLGVTIPSGEVTVKFNLRGRDYEKEGKVYNFVTLQAWFVGAYHPIPKVQATQPQAPVNTAPPAPSVPGDDDSQLPF